MDQFPENHFQHLRCIDLSQELSESGCMNLVTFLKKYVVPTAAAAGTATGHNATSKTTAVVESATPHSSCSSSSSSSALPRSPFQLQLCLRWPYQPTELAHQCMNGLVQILEHDDKKAPEEKSIGHLELELHGFSGDGTDTIRRVLRAHSRCTNVCS